MRSAAQGFALAQPLAFGCAFTRMLTLDMLDFGIRPPEPRRVGQAGSFNDTVCDDSTTGTWASCPRVVRQAGVGHAARVPSSTIGRRRARLGSHGMRARMPINNSRSFSKCLQRPRAVRSARCQIVSRNGAALLVRYKRRPPIGRVGPPLDKRRPPSDRVCAPASIGRSPQSARRTWLIPSFLKDG